MALSGVLARLGWEETEIETFLTAVTEAAGDEESDKRLHAVTRSVERAETGAGMTGWPTLAKLLGEKVVALVREYLAVAKGKPKTRATQEDAAQPAKHALRLVSLVEERGAELFHDPEGRAYMAVRIDGHRATFMLKSSAFRDWLAHFAHASGHGIPSKQSLEEAEGTLAGRAIYEGPERGVGLRVAGHDGRIYLDLCDKTWSAVEIDAKGWRVVKEPPVYFRRTKGMLPLPAPVEGGDLRSLKRLLNLGEERNWRLAVGWLLGCLRPQGPYPILALYGEQGSAKSTTAKGLRHLVDPHSTPVRSAPRDENDLAVAAHNNRLIAYDNLSDIPKRMSDVLCQLATGAGFGKRKFYTDDEEHLITVSRPVLLNGIASEMISRPDLLERTLLVELPAIADHARRTEEQVWRDLDAARPGLLGALLTAVSEGLRRQHDIEVGSLPRMADFARWVEACRAVLGWPPGEFVASLREMRSELEDQALSLWPVAPVLFRLVQDGSSIECTYANLLERLNKKRVGDEAGRVGDWPNTAKALAGELRRYTPNLRNRGIEVTSMRRTNAGHRVRIRRIAAPAREPVRV
jgi:hypothetical protein